MTRALIINNLRSYVSVRLRGRKRRRRWRTTQILPFHHMKLIVVDKIHTYKTKQNIIFYFIHPQEQHDSHVLTDQETGRKCCLFHRSHKLPLCFRLYLQLFCFFLCFQNRQETISPDLRYASVGKLPKINSLTTGAGSSSTNTSSSTNSECMTGTISSFATPPPSRRKFFNHKNLKSALTGHRRTASNGGCPIDTSSVLSGNFLFTNFGIHVFWWKVFFF